MTNELMKIAADLLLKGDRENALAILGVAETTQPQAPATEPGTWTDGQRRAIFARLGTLGFTGDYAGATFSRWDLVTMILGRPVFSFTSLSEQEASRLLDALHSC